MQFRYRDFVKYAASSSKSSLLTVDDAILIVSVRCGNSFDLSAPSVVRLPLANMVRNVEFLQFRILVFNVLRI